MYSELHCLTNFSFLEAASHPDELVAHCAPANISPGEVILFHEGQQWTLEALPRIVRALREANYELVTMAELIGE